MKMAGGYFNEGYNCAESVWMAMHQAWQAGEPNIRLATPFGAGMGRLGSVCGAVSGGILAIGLKYGRDHQTDTDGKETAYQMARQFYTRFEKEFGTALCRELTDCDLTIPEGREKYEGLGLSRKCTQLVEGAVRILSEL